MPLQLLALGEEEGRMAEGLGLLLGAGLTDRLPVEDGVGARVHVHIEEKVPEGDFDIRGDSEGEPPHRSAQLRIKTADLITGVICFAYYVVGATCSCVLLWY